MIGFWWGNGAEGMDILTACEVLEVKRDEGEIFYWKIIIKIYTIVYTEESKKSSSKVKEELRSEKIFRKD